MALAVADIWMATTGSWQHLATPMDANALATREQRQEAFMVQLAKFMTANPAVMQCAHCQRALLSIDACRVMSMIHAGPPVWSYVCAALACLPADMPDCAAHVTLRVRAQWQAYRHTYYQVAGRPMHRVCGQCHTLEADPAANKYKTCGRCKMTHYCSPKCQQANWTEHKLYCIEHE